MTEPTPDKIKSITYHDHSVTIEFEQTTVTLSHEKFWTIAEQIELGQNLDDIPWNWKKKQIEQVEQEKNDIPF